MALTSMVQFTLIDSWRDWFQVALTVLALGYLLRALTHTPGRNAALGIAALLLTYGLLKLADLRILAGILEQVLRVGVIVLVVLFRDELRQLLAQLGKRARQIFRATSTPEASRTDRRVVEEIAAAAERLSHSGKGALIVIEMEDALQEVADSGYPLDAALTAALLEAIFTSTSPLHDGAVIVRDLRIVAAGSVLPLYRGDLTELRRRGTRHRAALGLASAYDAAVVVVSEERGTIRVARNGKLIPVDRDHVRRELVSILTNDEVPENNERHDPGALVTVASRAVVQVMNGWDALVGWVRNRGAELGTTEEPTSHPIPEGDEDESE